MILHEIRRPNFLKIVPSRVANYRNLPFSGRATRGSSVRLPRKENARSCHQCLFEENVGKTGKVWSINFNCERFGSYFYTWGRYQHPKHPSQRMTAFNQMCNIMSSICFIFPFYVFMFFMGLLYFLSFCDRQGCFPHSCVSSIAMRKPDLCSSFRTKSWLTEQRSFKALDH